MKSCDLLIKGKYILPMDDALSVITDGTVAVTGTTIAAIGSCTEIEKEYTADKTLDAGNAIIMPGMVNTHTHAAMTYFRGMADDKPLDVWLKRHIWPAEARYVKPDFVRRSSELAVIEMLKAGVTCFNDMYFFEEVTAEVAAAAGMRAVIGECILDFPTPSAANPDAALELAKNLARKYSDHELISVAIAPHSVYGCSRDTWVKAGELSEKRNLPLHIHLCETKKEVVDARNNYKQSPVEYLNALGLLSDITLAAHSIWLGEDDLEILKKQAVKICHCPVSNMKLASGVMPYARMRALGLSLSFGSDSAASNNTLGLFSEMRVAALLHKVNTQNPAAAPARDLVRMATRGGAEALGLIDRTGYLAPGMRADLIAVSLDKPHLTPFYDPYSHLVHCANAGDVDNVIINGKVAMRNREVLTLDEERIIKEARHFVGNLQ